MNLVNYFYMTLRQLTKKLLEIKALGFVNTVRAHQGGVGNTLEYYLNIKENNLRIPDLGEIEVKAKRIDSKSMLTLSSKAPLPRGVNKVLFNNYKYPDPQEKFKLYTTVRGSKTNNRGFRIRVERNKLILENLNKIIAYWPLEKLDDVLKVGSEEVLLVLAETKGDFGKSNEKFHYTEAYLLSELGLEKLQKAILLDYLKVDIRIGYDLTGKNAGKYHDHGTGFRIFKNHYLYLFKNLVKIM